MKPPQRLERKRNRDNTFMRGSEIKILRRTGQCGRHKRERETELQLLSLFEPKGLVLSENPIKKNKNLKTKNSKVSNFNSIKCKRESLSRED